MDGTLYKPKVKKVKSVDKPTIDKSLRIHQRVYLKIQSIISDMIKFLGDISRYDKHAIADKSSRFIKRIYVKFSKVMGGLAHEAKKITRGFRKLKEDVKYSINQNREIRQTKYMSHSYSNTKKLRDIKTDVIKFIPFSFFLIIPGLEFFIPAWLIIFPNAIPSQFLSSDARNKKLQRLIQMRNHGAEKLLYIIPRYLNDLLKDNLVEETHKK